MSNSDDKHRREIKILLRNGGDKQNDQVTGTDVLQEENNLKAIQDEYATMFLEQYLHFDFKNYLEIKISKKFKSQKSSCQI